MVDAVFSMDSNQALNSLANFQAHSRLHFIGQWKTKAEDICAELYETDHPEWNHGPLLQQALFVHVDMDAFFCSAVLTKPENAGFADKPVAIAPGRINSEISSCNYLSRSYGVRAGMWVRQARELCPELVTLAQDLPRCEALNRMIYRVLLEQCPVGVSMAMEVYSVDDVMVAFDRRDYSMARDYCERIRTEISSVTNGCTASCGIGDNILVARLATSFAKPNGVKCVEGHEMNEFIRSVCVKDLHGVGRASRAKLAPILLPLGLTAESSHAPLVADPRGGVTDEGTLLGNDEPAEAEDAAEDGQDDLDGQVGNLRCTVLQQVPKATLQTVLGAKNGESLYNMCRGIDHRVVRRTGDKVDQAMLGKTMAKVVGCSMNYAVRPQTPDDVDGLLRQLLADVLAKLRRNTATTSSLRVGVLERHPAYPKTTTKFNGCGRCVEHSIAVPLSRPLSGEQGFEIEQAVLAAVRPRLRQVRSLSDEERLRQITGAVGANDPHFHFEVLRKDSSSSEIQIDDIRGISVNANGLAPVSYRAAASNMLSKVQRVKSAMSGQITLTAAFAKVADNRAAPAEVLLLSCSSGGSVEEIDFVTSQTPLSAAVEGQPVDTTVDRKRPRHDNSGELAYRKLRSAFPIQCASDLSIMDVTCAVRWCLAGDNIAAVKSLLRQIACAVESGPEGTFDRLHNAVDVEVTAWINGSLPVANRRPLWHLEFEK